jgi:hypothetical protein
MVRKSGVFRAGKERMASGGGIAPDLPPEARASVMDILGRVYVVEAKRLSLQ